MDNQKREYKIKVKKLFKKIKVEQRKILCPCIINQLLVIIVPLSLLGLFTVIFIPVYLSKNKNNNKPNNSTYVFENEKNIQNEQEEANIINEQNEHHD